MRPLRLMIPVACCFLILLAPLVCPTPCSAGNTYGIGENVSLADLLAGGTIVAGDKQFSDFDYNLATGNLQPEDIGVIGIFDSVLGGYGLSFSGDFVAGGLFAPLRLEAGLLFTVTALDPDYVISDVHLDGTTFVLGTGQARIVENFAGVNVPSLSIFETRLDDVLFASQSSDDIFFPDDPGTLGFRSLRVMKDINIQAGDNFPVDLAEITTFQQVFTQLPVNVPEPASWGLVVLMGLGIAGVRNRWRLR